MADDPLAKAVNSQKSDVRRAPTANDEFYAYGRGNERQATRKLLALDKGLKADSENKLAGSYAKGGQVGGVRGFGLDNRSKPAFAAGGPKTNFKSNFKKGD